MFEDVFGRGRENGRRGELGCHFCAVAVLWKVRPKKLAGSRGRLEPGSQSPAICVTSGNCGSPQDPSAFCRGEVRQCTLGQHQFWL